MLDLNKADGGKFVQEAGQPSSALNRTRKRSLDIQIEIQHLSETHKHIA